MREMFVYQHPPPPHVLLNNAWSVNAEEKAWCIGKTWVKEYRENKTAQTTVSDKM